MIPGLRIIDDILKGLPDNSRLRGEIVELRSQVSILHAQKEELESENAQLKLNIEKQNEENSAPEHLDGPAFFVISLLASHVSGITANDISRTTGRSVNDVMVHIDEFREWGLVEIAGGDMGHGCEYRLTPSGRAYYRALDEKEHNS